MVRGSERQRREKAHAEIAMNRAGCMKHQKQNLQETESSACFICIIIMYVFGSDSDSSRAFGIQKHMTTSNVDDEIGANEITAL